MSDTSTAPAVAPTLCPGAWGEPCGAPRTWEIDMAGGDEDAPAEWFAWCEPCAVATFPSEDASVRSGALA